MTERGFITPPPGLLPEPVERPVPSTRGDTERRADLPVFFPAAPGAAPATDTGGDRATAPQPRVAAPPASGQSTAAPAPVAPREISLPESAPAPASVPEPLKQPVAVPVPDPAPEPMAQAAPVWTLELEGVPLGALPEVLVLGRAPVTSVSGARALAVSGGGTVSKTHAIFRRDGDSVTVEDLGSTNGSAVIVDGERTLLVANQPVRVDGPAEIWLAQAHLVLRRG